MVASSFVCGYIALMNYLSVSLGRQNATLHSFTGDGFGRFGLEACWGFFVSHVVAMLGFLCLWLHCWGFLCLWLHHLSVSSSRQNATLESFTGDGFGRFGLESFCLWLHHLRSFNLHLDTARVSFSTIKAYVV